MMNSLLVCAVGWSALVALFFPGALEAADEAAGETSNARAARILADSGVQGGLVVHVGCGDGRLTAALRASDSYLVHGLDADPANVEQARQHLRQLGVYGPVSVDRLYGNRLPYIDNAVNLLVVSGPLSVAREEILRVLCPGGVALTVTTDQGQLTTDKFVKPRPAEVDDWTHYLHNPTNNAVSQDTMVGPPGHLQWVGSPPWSRHHDHMASASAMVSCGGRLFYIFDEGPTASILLPAKVSLVARDAFNGVVLWKRPVTEWHPHLWKLKSGPSQLPRRLVAVDQTVYVTLGIDAPLAALDAATGRTLRTYEGTRATEEILYSEGVLLLVTGDQPFRQPPDPKRFDYNWEESERHVMAVRADSGQVLWKKTFSWVAPLTLAADSRRVYFHDGDKVVGLDRTAGHTLWVSEPVARKKPLPSDYAPTLVVYGDVVLFTGGENLVAHRGADDTMTALSAETGKTLWTAPHPPSGYQSPEDILVANGLVWTGAVAAGEDSGRFTGRDPQTGEVVRDFLPDGPQRYGHHRCYRAKATERFLLTSRNGIEFLDVQGLQWSGVRWVRGGCLYGIMPANGLIYTPAHDCACFIESKLYGFTALAAERKPKSERVEESTSGQRLEKGPAYKIQNPKSEIQNPNDWPTYRHDAARSGYVETSVPADVQQIWQVQLGGRLTSPVVAGGKLLVAVRDAHTVHAFDADAGQPAWSFTAGGRIDSPPAVDEGRVLFGSADGWVYCLRLADGALAWRFRAAPEDRRLVAWEQLESVWPVPGNVLVRDGVAWAACGRSVFLDGGLRMLRLNAATGEKLSEVALDASETEVGLPDILSCDGQYVYMRSQVFDLEGNRVQVRGARDVQKQAGESAHLFCPTGFLDDSWWHRSYWVFGRSFRPGAMGYFLSGRFAPSGKLLVFDDRQVYGFTRQPQYFRWTTPLERHLFASSRQPQVLRDPPKPQKAAKKPVDKSQLKPGVLLAQETQDARIALDWKHDIPLIVRAMVLADRTLFVAGPPDVLDEVAALAAYGEADTQQQLARQAAALEGAQGSLLWAVSAADGSKLAELTLPGLPVFDGLIAAGGKLYLTTTDGQVLCFGGKPAAGR